MANNLNQCPWEPARLIPVSGKQQNEEQERRSASAMLAVLSIVKDFTLGLLKPFGAPSGKIETFIEVPIKLADGRTVRPDGLIRITGRGGKCWTALVEVKTGLNELEVKQVEDYLDAAAKEAFDCVITISNQIMKIRGQHPLEIDKKRTKKISLEHLSWSRILTEAIRFKSGHKVDDPEQAWILSELIRYLEHPKTGAMDFQDMGAHWTEVRDGIKNGTLRQTDQHAFEVAGKWEELLSFAVLGLGRELGVDVEQVWSRSEQGNLSLRIDNIVKDMVEKSELLGRIRIPDAVGDIDIKVDLRGQQVEASLKISAPKEGRSKTRINWLLRQLKNSSENTRLESWALRARMSQSDLLGKVREDQALLLPPDDKEISSFTISNTVPMGHNKKRGRNSFIDSVLELIDLFYRDVVQNLREWQPTAPKLAPAKSRDELSDLAPVSAPFDQSKTVDTPVSHSADNGVSADGTGLLNEETAPHTPVANDEPGMNS